VTSNHQLAMMIRLISGNVWSDGKEKVDDRERL